MHAICGYQMNYFAVHPWMLSCQWHRIPSDLCGTSSNNHWMIWLFKISPWPCSFESWHTVTGEKYTSYNHFHTSPYIFHGISKEILWVALPKRDIPHDLIAIGYTYTLKTTGSTGNRPDPTEARPSRRGATFVSAMDCRVAQRLGSRSWTEKPLSIK